jgi:hypothetical protein
MTLVPFRSRDRASPASAHRREPHAGEILATLSELGPDPDGPILPETRRLLDRLLAAEDLDQLAAPSATDAERLLAYRVRPETDGPHVRFRFAEAEEGLLRFLGRSEPGFEVLEVRQAGLQFHWRSDLLRAFDEQAAILCAFCAFAPHGELVLEHLAIPVIRRHRVREVRGWIALGRDLAEDLCGPDRLSMTRRPLRPRLVALPRPLLHPQQAAWTMAGTVTQLHARWRRREPSAPSR